MADRTTQSIVIAAPVEKVMAAIADIPAYPDWVSTCKAAEILETGPDGKAKQARFLLDAGMLKDTYELEYTWSVDGSAVSWELLSSSLQKSQSGSYTLVADGDKTKVTYQLTVDVDIPMIGLLKRKAEKMITDAALKELKKRVEG
ncbi:MAG: SRPBCC family protein [Mycobacteriaceae bacterium]